MRPRTILRSTLIPLVAAALIGGCSGDVDGEPGSTPVPVETARPTSTGTVAGAPAESATAATQPASTATARSPSQGITVVAVTDGDTIDVRIGGDIEPVRLIGINSPERGECFYDEAAARLAELLLNAEVRLESDVSNRDQFGRLLRYVFVGDELINEVVVREGYAIARRYEPDVSMAGRLDSAQAHAQARGLGLWGSGACGAPATGTIEIGFIRYNANGDDNENKNDEWVEFINAGEGPIDLTGWSVKDESASHRFYFPSGFSLGPGATVRLHTGCGTATTTALFWCNRDSAVWNNGGDTVFVLDPVGNIAVSRRY